MSKLFLVVPVYNEEENIPGFMTNANRIARELSQYEMTCLFVDDGSTDKTADVVRNAEAKFCVQVISLPKNQGPGAAFATGFEWLSTRVQTDDWVVTLEGDNTSRFELLKQMLKRTEEGYDVILASPYMYSGGISNTTAFRTFLSFVANFFVKELLGLRGLVTMSSFYRLYRGKALLKLYSVYGPRIIERTGFESMIELLMKMVYLQMRISEVPMNLDSSLRKGKSKMKIAKTIFGYLRLWQYRSSWQAQIEELNPTAVGI